MKISIALCLVTFAVCVYSETCTRLSDCHETKCSSEHGWWLHCTKGNCLCTHDTFIGKNCTDGASATCDAIHGSRCTDHNLVWRCIDSVCHCSRPRN
ncbi:serine protease inhibitor Cvsi-1-like [Mercenaria mercenaria]|uniref:serine protease inhibitor Cvsi-1-like n=1 Tax=Mercenaria mercenaria TaxID=6596 RepID=UPI001E1DBB78|nr:serine protease inhibitor Cvsi-1-like [Mercenaria mercenaria]